MNTAHPRDLHWSSKLSCTLNSTFTPCCSNIAYNCTKENNTPH